MEASAYAERRARLAQRTLRWALAGAWLGFLLVPWYAIEDGFFTSWWLPWYPLDPELGPAPVQAIAYGRWWLLLHALPLAGATFMALRTGGSARALLALAAAGIVYGGIQGNLVGPLGWMWPSVESLVGAIDGKQYGMGYGALLYHAGLMVVASHALAAKGACRGDRFVTLALGSVVVLVGLFVLLPVGTILLKAFETDAGGYSLTLLGKNITSERLWRLSASLENCGVAWKTLVLGLLTSVGCTVLGFAFALLLVRTRIRFRGALRAFSILPVITPPFVIGMALILTFGRAGWFTLWLESAFGLAPSRYIFGLPGIWLAQMVAFTPVAFLVLVGVLEGVSPALEEASQTLGARPLKTFTTVTLPLARPGLANAFLISFIESVADFGNPMVLGGSYDVLSTDVYFAVAGAQNDIPRAAALAIVLLAFTLGAFYAQRKWLGRASYVTMTGKGETGLGQILPPSIRYPVLGVTLPWAAFTTVLYGMVLFGGFVTLWGQDHSLTMKHFVDVFEVRAHWSSAFPDVALVGGAWPSLITTLWVAAIAAPITAALGLLVSYLLSRQDFRGKEAFEFSTMLSFAVPGTVIGLGYVLAFNIPPVELTGTAIVLIVSFVFRNMPVGIRAGLAGLAQIDPSLDQASLTLRQDSLSTFRRVLLPLLRPAVVVALVYGFIRAMTAISAVIFLVSAEHDLATTYILGRIEYGNYGAATAYSAALIVLMLVVILGMQRLVGRSRTRRLQL